MHYNLSIMSITEYIKKGHRNAYSELFFLNPNGGDLHSKAIEYLFTINIVQELINWKVEAGDFHNAIRLEFNEKEFKKRCFPHIKISGDDIFELKHQIRGNHRGVRSDKGRVDIVILQDSSNALEGDRSVFAIEVKGINPSWKKVEEDLNRLIGFLIATDPIGENSLKECFMIYGKRLDKQNKVYSSEEYERDKKHETDKVRSKISEIVNLKGVNVSVEIFDMTKNFVEAYEGINYEPYDQPDYSELASDTGAVVGILLTLKRE